MNALIEYGIFGLVLHIISPLLFIWSVNTLFNAGIPFSFKTWFAGLILIIVVRFHLRVGRSVEASDLNEDHGEKEDEEGNPTETLEEEVERLRIFQENLKRYKDARRKLRGRR